MKQTQAENRSKLDELIETSDCDGILTEDGIILTRVGIARLRAQSSKEKKAPNKGGDNERHHWQTTQ
jgi:hypothetical protein